MIKAVASVYFDFLFIVVLNSRKAPNETNGEMTAANLAVASDCSLPKKGFTVEGPVSFLFTCDNDASDF